MPGVTSDYRSQVEQELAHWNSHEGGVHELPAIFHYWSRKYVRPLFQSLKVEDSESFFVYYIEKVCRLRSDLTPAVMSLGAGNGDTEIRLARMLLNRGIPNFRFLCVDLSPKMLALGEKASVAAGLESHFEWMQGDFNSYLPDRSCDIVLANHSLHHCLQLEWLYKKIKTLLNPGGYFVIHDMIGRNGHQRWPEALAMVEKLWESLPVKYKYNHALKRFELKYENWDCSAEAFEGIRSQDILPLLIHYFHFDSMLAYANLIDIFVDRGFGPNFDPANAWDRSFIDDVARLDMACLKKSILKPTHLLAAVILKPVKKPRYYEKFTPAFCVRPTDALTRLKKVSPFREGNKHA